MQPVVQNPGTHGDLSSVFIITCQHGQNGFYVLPGDRAEGISAGKDLHHFINGIRRTGNPAGALAWLLIFLCGRHGDQMLCQYIQAHAGRAGLLDASLSGSLGSHAAVQGFRGSTGVHIHDTDPPRIVPGAAKALHGTGYGAGTANLQYLVNVTHVNAQLHGGGSAEQAQISPAQGIF